jgi:prepilin-type N-terminal cleavage/methylation domain-containing protein
MKPLGKRWQVVAESGFSVIELMVVVIILTAILAASVPGLVRHTETLRLREASNNVAGT